MALADISDVMDLTGKEYTDSEVWQLDTLLGVASREIQLETGQTFEYGVHVWKPQRNSWKYVLPQRPVASVTSVTDIDGNAISYTFDGVDTIQISAVGLIRLDLDPIASWAPRIVITYVAGYEIIPDDIKAIAIGMSLRAFGAEAEDSGLTQEAITSYSYQRGQAAAAGAIGMLPLEKSALRFYQLPRRAAVMSIGIGRG